MEGYQGISLRSSPKIGHSHRYPLALTARQRLCWRLQPLECLQRDPSLEVRPQAVCKSHRDPQHLRLFAYRDEP